MPPPDPPERLPEITQFSKIGFDVPWKPTKRGLEFDNYLVLVQAALDGQGIALGGGRLAEDFISRRTLVRPITSTLRSSRGFYLLVPQDVPLSQPAKLFRDWIVSEAKGSKKTSKSIA